MVLLTLAFVLVFPAALAAMPIPWTFKGLILLVGDLLRRGKPTTRVRKIEDRAYIYTVNFAFAVFLSTVVWALWSVQSNLKDPQSSRIVEYLFWMFAFFLMGTLNTVATTRFGVVDEPKSPGEPS